MKRDTVGKIASDLLLKKPESTDPIELEREMHKDYESQVITCCQDGKKFYDDDFFIIVITKKERIMQNVLRNYFFHRQACPTPDYDQAVYRYNSLNDSIEFIWVVPSKDTCILFMNNVMNIAPEERQLLQNVLDFADGTLYKRAKTLNGEEISSIILAKD